MPVTLISLRPPDDPENPPNEAEQKVAESLMQLGDDFMIRWGFYHANENGSIQGEGDFLVLGPDGNVLHIEVKLDALAQNRQFLFRGGPGTSDPAYFRREIPAIPPIHRR